MSEQAAIDQLLEDFELLDDWEDRYRYVIELGRDLPPLDPAEKSDESKVRGCASQVWLLCDASDGRLTFRGESDALIVQGLIAVLLKIFNDKTPRQILETDALGIFTSLGFNDHLTPQRSNGLASMVQRIRQDAERAL